MKTFKLSAADRGSIKNNEFTGYAVFNNGQQATKRPGNFGPVYVLNDDTLLPGSFLGMHPHANVEIITIVVSGEESHEDTLGIHENYFEGDIQLISAGSGLQHAGGNPSKDAVARHLQIWIAPKALDTSPRVSVLKSSDKHSGDGRRKLIISPDGADGSIQIDQDIWISELKLHGAESYTLSSRGNGLGYIIYIIDGKVEIAGENLGQGDTLLVNDPVNFQIMTEERATSIMIIETLDR